MNDHPPRVWFPLALLAGALVVWAGLLALGAYLEAGADAPRHDVRKALVVLGTMAGFLAFWGAALWLRQKRRPRPRGKSTEAAAGEGKGDR